MNKELVMFRTPGRSTIYINPAHVSAIAETYHGTRITLANGKTVEVQEDVGRVEYRLRTGAPY